MPVSDVLAKDVEDAHCGALRPRAGRGGHGDERMQAMDGRPAEPDRGVDVVEQVTGVRRHEIDRLGGVDHGPPSHRDERIPGPALGRCVDRFAHGRVARFDCDPVVQPDLVAGSAQRRHDPVGCACGRHPGIGHDEHASLVPQRVRISATAPRPKTSGGAT